MNSYVAGVVTLIQAGVLASRPQAVTPVPLPPEAVFPHVTVQQALGQELESLAGASGLVRTVMQVNVWDADYDRAFQLRASIVEYLRAHLGVVAGVSGLTLQSVNVQQDSELYDGVRELHQVIGRYLCWWEL